jgi:hypothetical protein
MKKKLSSLYNDRWFAIPQKYRIGWMILAFMVVIGLLNFIIQISYDL